MQGVVRPSFVSNAHFLDHPGVFGELIARHGTELLGRAAADGKAQLLELAANLRIADGLDHLSVQSGDDFLRCPGRREHRKMPDTVTPPSDAYLAPGEPMEAGAVEAEPTPRERLEQLRTVFLIINSALGLLGGISLLVASFGIANTMIMSILERTREIGIMKAIGAEDREIKLIFFVEAGVIGLTGGVLGALLAWAIDAVANRLAYRFILQPQGASYVDFFALPPYLWLGAIIFALLVSILAALYPAARAARIDPVKALRHD